ncbi:hypothetical protein ACFWYW_23445 [Nonomuraea sp. NPDC059023]|uniref:hypothetical protein n=1 Tax=unclassified Nonomuraea TaxID=2593643 RepID=UPI0036AB63E1
MTRVHPRWSAVRKVAGYGAAATLSLYLVVKVAWVAAALLGIAPAQSGMDTTEWVTLNAITVVMALAGVALGLALAQRWGRRIPGPPLLFFAWVGAGFLVPMIPYGIVSVVLGADGGDAAMPGWETIGIGVGFAGMAVGLAVALPIYLRERWPRAFLGRLGELAGTGRAGRPGELPGTGRAFLLAGLMTSAGLGLLWGYRAFGGSLGLDPAHVGRETLDGLLMRGNWGAWALLGAGCGWSLIAARPSRLPLGVPVAVVFLASGSLFAWGSWKLLWAVVRPGGFATVEYPVVAVTEHALSVCAGLVLMATVLRTCRAQAATLERRTG